MIQAYSRHPAGFTAGVKEIKEDDRRAFILRTDNLAAMKEKDEITNHNEAVLKETIAQLNTLLKEGDARIEKLQDDCRRESDKVLNLTADLREKDEEPDYFRHELNERTRELSDAKAEIASLTAKLLDARTWGDSWLEIAKGQSDAKAEIERRRGKLEEFVYMETHSEGEGG